MLSLSALEIIDLVHGDIRIRRLLGNKDSLCFKFPTKWDLPFEIFIAVKSFCCIFVQRWFLCFCFWLCVLCLFSLLFCGDRLVGLVVKASASRVEEVPGLESHLRQDFSRVESYQWLQNWHSSGYPARVPGVIGSVLGLVGPVPVYCDWVRCKVWSANSVSVWQHMQLSEQIRPWDTLACNKQQIAVLFVVLCFIVRAFEEMPACVTVRLFYMPLAFRKIAMLAFVWLRSLTILCLL